MDEPDLVVDKEDYLYKMIIAFKLIPEAPDGQNKEWFL